MGLETFALIGLSVLSASQQMKQAEQEADAIIQQANNESRNKAKEIRQRTARAQVSFLNSGLSLEGTPIAAIEGMFDSGIEDLNLIKSNAETKAKNKISNARTNAILGFGKTVLGFFDGGTTGGDTSGGNPFANAFAF